MGPQKQEQFMIEFTKMHGLGNDFVIFRNVALSPEQIKQICDRHRGVGCDQLVIIGEQVDFYNADGSASSTCGNASRCVAFLLMEEQGVDEVTLNTAAGALTCWREAGEVAVNMGKARREWRQIPLANECDTLHEFSPGE